MQSSHGKKALTQTKSKPADVFDTDVFEAASISGGDVKAVASTNAPPNSLAASATVLVACPDSRGVKKQVLLLGAADGGGLGGWSGPGWSAARAVVESEAGPMI